MVSTLQKAGVMAEFMSVKASLPPIGVGYELDLPEIGIAYENKENHDRLEDYKANFDVEEEQEDDCDRSPYTSYLIIEPQGGDEDVRETYLASIIDNFRDEIAQGAKYHLGYPCNMEFDYTALEHLYHVPINNLGDPHVERNYGIHSKEFEIGVLDWFANLWDLEKDEYWGYVTYDGTEGNLHGLLIGRELFPDGILYASKDSHYSVCKAAWMYRMQLEKVDCLIKGQMNCKDFRRKLVQNKGKPAIVVVNIGTTVKGAIDDLDMIIKILEESGYDHDRFYIHCDAALFGLIMPFAKGAPKISFKKPIGSVSVSGHKFVGTPTTCGVQITKMEYINTLKREESSDCIDATIIDSRDGHASMFLWYTLNKKGYQGIQKDVQRCLQNAQYLKDRLWSSRISVMLNEPSIIVVFEKPGDENFIRKWQLACQGNIAHVIVMQNVIKEKLDSFVHELIENRPKWLVDGKTPCIANEIGNENCFCAKHRHI